MMIITILFTVCCSPFELPRIWKNELESRREKFADWESNEHPCMALMNHHGQTGCICLALYPKVKLCYWSPSYVSTISMSTSDFKPLKMSLVAGRHRSLCKEYSLLLPTKETPRLEILKCYRRLPTTSRCLNFQQSNLTYSSLKQQMEHPNFWISTLDPTGLT